MSMILNLNDAPMWGEEQHSSGNAKSGMYHESADLLMNGKSKSEELQDNCCSQDEDIIVIDMMIHGFGGLVDHRIEIHSGCDMPCCNVRKQSIPLLQSYVSMRPWY